MAKKETTKTVANDAADERMSAGLAKVLDHYRANMAACEKEHGDINRPFFVAGHELKMLCEAVPSGASSSLIALRCMGVLRSCAGADQFGAFTVKDFDAMILGYELAQLVNDADTRGGAQVRIIVPPTLAELTEETKPTE